MTSDTGVVTEFAEERRARILSLVNLRGRVKVSDLAEELNVTPPTIRKDISALDQQKKLHRTHGGALAARPFYEVEIETRRDANVEAKRLIARACVSLISSNDSIFLDAGTTTLAIAEALVDDARTGHPAIRNLNVLTNSVPAARLLADVGSIRHTLLGGQYRSIADSLSGPVALQTARQFTVNIAFIGVTGVSGHRFSVADLSEADLKREIIERSHRVVVPMDATKRGITDFVSLCEFDVVDVIVSDADDAYLSAESAARDVEWIVAQ